MIYAAYSTATLFVPRISSEQGLASLKDQNEKTLQFSEEMWKAAANYRITTEERVVTVDYLAGINHLAASAAASRAIFFEKSQKFVWLGILNDISDIHNALGDYGSTHHLEAERRIKEFNDALLLVETNGLRSMETLRNTKSLVTNSKKNLYTDIKLLRTLLDAASNEHLLLHDSGRTSFSDVTRLQDASWGLFELHQQMIRDYNDSNRLAAALIVITGK